MTASHTIARVADVRGIEADESIASHGASDPRAEDSVIPRSAMLLAGAGLVPFAGLSAAAWLTPAPLSGWLSTALVSYGAIILSFLGAVHWGLAMAGRRHPHAHWYALAVVPALIAWCATLLPTAAALTVLAATFAGVFAIDWIAVRTGSAPPWYRRLRLPLTLAVVASLTLGAVAAWRIGS